MTEPTDILAAADIVQHKFGRLAQFQNMVTNYSPHDNGSVLPTKVTKLIKIENVGMPHGFEFGISYIPDVWKYSVYIEHRAKGYRFLYFPILDQVLLWGYDVGRDPIKLGNCHRKSLSRIPRPYNTVFENWLEKGQGISDSMIREMFLLSPDSFIGIFYLNERDVEITQNFLVNTIKTYYPSLLRPT